MRDAIARFDFCSYLIVAVGLFVAAMRIGQSFPRLGRRMVWGGIAVLLAVGSSGYTQVRPTSSLQVLGIAIVAWICASAAALAVAVLLPPFLSLYDGWREQCERWQREQEYAAQLAREETERRKVEEEEAEQKRRREQREAERNKPPPTREERIAGAKSRYETAMAFLETSGLKGLELEAAQAKAKQEYLKALNHVFS